MNATLPTKRRSPLGEAPIWAIVTVAALWLVPLIGAPFGGLNPDTARDIYWAWQVASGQEFPLAGPIIGYFVHLGPGWYYTLAIPLALHSSYTFAALFVTALAGLKYPAALYLGARLFDWRMGLLWACLLALPSLSYLTQLTISHFSLVEGTLLLFLSLCLWDFEKRRSSTAFLAALSFSVMLHAHPTTVTLGWLFFLLLWIRGRDWWKVLPLIAAGGILPFLPLLFAQVGNEGRDLQAVVTYLKSDLVFSRLVDVPVLLFNTLAIGVPSAWRLAANSLPALVPMGFALLALLGAATLAGTVPAWQSARLRKWLLLSLAGFLLFGAQVSLLRVETWWYMMIGSLPFLALFGAVALRALIERFELRFLLPAVACLAVCMLLVHSINLIQTGLAGERHYYPLPKLANLKNPKPFEPQQLVPWLPYVHLDEMAEVLCEQPEPVIVHGALALQADAASGIATEMHCGRPGDVYLGGQLSGQATHLLAFGPRVVGTLGFAPVGRIGSFGRYHVARAIYPAEPEPLASTHHFQPREWARGLSERRTVEFETSAEERVSISNPLIWWWEMRVVSVQAQSRPAREVARDVVSTVYACADCPSDETITWRVEYLAAEGHALDIVSLSPEASGDETLGPRNLDVTIRAVE